MSMRGGRRADAPPSRLRIRPTILAGALFTLSVVATSAVAAWPIYRSTSFLVLVVVSSILAGVIALVARLRSWTGWLVACVLAAVFLVVGVPLAVPSRLGAPDQLLAGLGELVSGIAVAWKDLVTVDLPVGSYRNLLVPALVVFLVGTCAMLLLSWLDGRRAYLATPVALAMVSFGLFFGRSAVSDPVSWGPVTLYAPVETALGVTGLLSCLLWLSWRTYDERMHALQRAAVSSGVRVSRHSSPADRRRAGLGVGMIALAVIVSVAVVPFAARGTDRDVLRTAVGPDLDLSRELSPLSQYRSAFSDERADEPLFSVAGEDELPDRVRLATLSEYDGSVFRVSAAEQRFVRVPSALDPGPWEPYALDVEISAWSGLWMPTAGRLATVRFTGARAANLADGFYYSAEASAGVQTAGLVAGDVFRLAGVEPPTPPLSSVSAPGAEPAASVPESLRAWMQEHVEGTDGAALEGLVTLLRERGYLSHALRDDPDVDEAWMATLPGYEFQPSASGHSLARIDALFTRLLERESDPRAAASDNYVAAIGDDEQFAVATALMARELGFPSRVVVGTRLASSDPGVAVCRTGVCRGEDLAAWVEVRSSRGEWIPVDVTPQFAQSPSLEVTRQRDPEVVTEVRPDIVEEIIPPEPVQQDAIVADPDDDDAGADLSWIGPAARIAAAVLLVLLLGIGPFAVVVIAKTLRRSQRRDAPATADRIVGGWEEYVDTAVDARRALPTAGTRTEIARAIGTPEGAALARIADRAVFAATEEAASSEADEYWEMVERDRRAILRDENAWRRLLATVSLRSIIRPLATPGTRTLFSERGRREALRPARQMP